MKILFGDATESPLQQDYLSLLSAVVDFGVAILSGLAEIVDLETDAQRLEDEATTAREQLDAVEEDLSSMLQVTAERTTARVAQACVAGLLEQGRGHVEQSRRRVDADLQQALSQVKNQIKAIRRKQLSHTGTLLMREAWPGATERVNLALTTSGVYQAELVGRSPLRLAWVAGLDVPPSHPLSEPLKVEDVVGPLSVDAPAEGGWVRKSVKRRATKLGKSVIAGFTHEEGGACLALRDTPDADTGYDVLFDEADRPVSGHLVADGERSEGFDIADDDQPGLAELARQLRALARRLMTHRRDVNQVQLDGEPLEAHLDPTQLIVRMVEHLTPIVADIEARSPLPGELVLKRAVEGGRREELFLSKADLAERLSALSPPAAAIFAPLGIAPVEPEMEAATDEELAALDDPIEPAPDVVEIDGDEESTAS